MNKTVRFLALTAVAVMVAAVPAMAVDFEFSGYYQAQFINSNFNGSTTTGALYLPDGLPADAPNASFFEQRARLGLVAKASPDLKLVTKFEIDYAYWGNSSYGVARNGGGALGSDGINFETKHVYLDFNTGPNHNFKVGMMPVADSFEGIILDSDAAGILFSGTWGKWSDALGFFRLADASDGALGSSTTDLLVLDGKYQVNDSTKVGMAYYWFMNENTGGDDASLHNLGVNVETVAGPATLNGFLLYQFGDAGGPDASAFAANIGAKAALGGGTLRAECLYGSGDSDLTDGDVKSVTMISDGEYGYYSGEMVLLGRDKYAMTTDNAIVYDVNNGGLGVILLTTGYDMALGAKGTGSVNLGLAWANEAGGRDGKLMGTELNTELGYQVVEGLTATLRAAYCFLGDFYAGVAENGADPDNPWDVKLILAYSF
jgi:hypothetical protein